MQRAGKETSSKKSVDVTGYVPKIVTVYPRTCRRSNHIAQNTTRRVVFWASSVLSLDKPALSEHRSRTTPELSKALIFLRYPKSQYRDVRTRAVRLHTVCLFAIRRDASEMNKQMELLQRPNTTAQMEKTAEVFGLSEEREVPPRHLYLGRQTTLKREVGRKSNHLTSFMNCTYIPKNWSSYYTGLILWIRIYSIEFCW